MSAKFKGKNIFGSQQRQTGPIAKMREQREALPGVRGYRVYQFIGAGVDTRTWTIRARMVATTLGRIQAAIANAQNLMGSFGTFEETGGGRWRDCELIDFRQTSDFKAVRIGDFNYCTVEVSATIEQAGG